MRDHLAHRYFGTAHTILQATVDEDLPELEQAVTALAESLQSKEAGVMAAGSGDAGVSGLGEQGDGDVRR